MTVDIEIKRALAERCRKRLARTEKILQHYTVRRAAND
jgi:hypothetical protein